MNSIFESEMIHFIESVLARGPIPSNELMLKVIKKFNTRIPEDFELLEFFDDLVTTNIIVALQYYDDTMSQSYKTVYFAENTYIRIVNFTRA